MDTKPYVLIYENVPAEVKAWADPVLKEFSFLVPGWVEDLFIRYDAESSNLMTAGLCYRNRWCALYFTGKTLGCSESERRITLLHELVHVLFSPAAETIDMAVESLPETQRPVFKTLFENSLEAVVEDTARAFNRAIGRKDAHD